MFFSRSKSQSLILKIPTKKSDGAPFILFIDIIKSNFFKSGITPVPLRIDKVSNGQLTTLIFPKKEISIEINGKKTYIAIENLINFGKQNLINYSKKKFNELTLTNLSENIIKKWWNNSKNYTSNLLSLEEDMFFILKEYLYLYKKLLNNNSDEKIKKYVLEYIQKGIDYWTDRLESNTFLIRNTENKIIEKKIYKKKKGKIYPEIIEYSLIYKNKEDNKENLKNKISSKKKIFNKQNKIKKAFLPYLIYEDLLDCFLYNKEIIERTTSDNELIKKIIPFSELTTTGIIKQEI